MTTYEIPHTCATGCWHCPDCGQPSYTRTFLASQPFEQALCPSCFYKKYTLAPNHVVESIADRNWCSVCLAEIFGKPVGAQTTCPACVEKIAPKLLLQQALLEEAADNLLARMPFREEKDREWADDFVKRASEALGW